MIYENTNWTAYSEGRQAAYEYGSDPAKAINPYEENSLAWQSWNMGWNTYFPKGGL